MLIKKQISMRKFVRIGFVAVFTVVAGYGVYTSQKSEVMSDLTLANVEALAGGTEIGPTPGGQSYNCVYGITYGGVGIARDCQGGCGRAYFIASYDGTSTCRL